MKRVGPTAIIHSSRNNPKINPAMNDKDNTYQPPAIAVYEIAAERGFAGSGEVNDYDDGGEF